MCGFEDPDLLVKCADPRIRIGTKMSRTPYTGEFSPTEKCKFVPVADPSLEVSNRISLVTTLHVADKDEGMMAGPLLRILLVLQLASQAARCKLGQFRFRVYRIRIRYGFRLPIFNRDSSRAIRIPDQDLRRLAHKARSVPLPSVQDPDSGLCH
jgi:hypothetical protein